jgi:hypothetical protein
LKLGVEFQSIRFSTFEPAYSRGDYTFNGQYSSLPGVSFTGYGVADFVTDKVNFAEVSNIANEPDSRWYRAAYAQDDWRVSPNLTVNLGLRYEYIQPYKELGDRQANWVPTSRGVGTGTATLYYPVSQQNAQFAAPFLNALTADNIALQFIKNPALTDAQFTNFSPRIGISYQLDKQTVVRAGFGIFYGALENTGGTPNLGSQYPFQFNSTYPAGNCVLGNCPTNGFTLEGGFTNAIGSGLLNSVSVPSLEGEQYPTMKTPYTQEENLTLQHSLSQNFSFSIGYVGSVGRHIFNDLHLNGAKAVQNPGNSQQPAAPFPAFSTGSNVIAMSGVTTYNSLQTRLDKRFSGGLSFAASYTWSHAMDDAPTTLGSAGDGGYRDSSILPPIADFSNSPWDTRHRVTLNGLYQLPFGTGRRFMNQKGIVNVAAGGWSTSLTFAAQTGNPFTVTPDITTVAGGSAKAIVVANPYAGGGVPQASNPSAACPAKVHTRTNWYNPCAFGNPLPGSLISPTANAGNPYLPLPGYSYPQYVTDINQVIAFEGGRREQVYGPGYERINMSLFKDFPTFREQLLEFRADIFNLLNTPAYGIPSTTTDSSSGGQITSARTFQSFTPDARFYQFSARWLFT